MAGMLLVTGAGGAIGPRVVEAALAAGHAVRALDLGPPPSVVPAGLEWRRGDVTDAAAVRDAMRGIHAVIHLAARLHVADPDPSLRPAYEAVNVGGTLEVLRAAREAGVRRVVFFSTIAVYGPTGGRLLTEDSAPRPMTLYGETKRAAERSVLEACTPEGEPIGTVLRMGAVYGPRVKGNYERLLRALGRGVFVPVGRGTNRRTLVYEKDAATAALLALGHPDAAGRVYNVSDGETPTMRRILDAMAHALGRRPPRLFVPLWAARLGVAALERPARWLGRRSVVSQSTLDTFVEDVAVSSERIRSELGFVPAHDLSSGWRETVSEWRASGRL